MTRREKTQATHTAAGKAVTDVILETFRLNGRLLAAGNELVRDLGVTSARWQVMGALPDGPLPAAQITRNMGLTRQSVQRIVDVLQEQDILEFSDNPYHQRAKLIGLTERGRQLFHTITERQIQWVNTLAQCLSVRELQAMTSLMSTLRKRLELPLEKE